MSRRVLCFDLGASSGRAMLAELIGGKIALREVHRFKNPHIILDNLRGWDISTIFDEIKKGLVLADNAGGFDCIGIDTWGVDYGIIDSGGKLLALPVQYRDSRTSGMTLEADKLLGLRELYRLTGTQVMEINTAFQLLADKTSRPELLRNGCTMLNIPDLLGFMLTGNKSAELSIASTTQLLDPLSHTWSDKVINALGLPRKLFPEIIMPGQLKGRLSEKLCRELGIPSAEVIAVCGHDTQCASFAAPASDADFLFLSCGTWSLLGTVTDSPCLSDAAFDLELTNESGFSGKINLLKNITGLWLVQETKEFLKSGGYEVSFAQLESLAENSRFCGLIDPDCPEFSSPGDMPEKIRRFCQMTGQDIPETTGDVMRCIYLSLAMKYRFAAEQISQLTGKKFPRIYIVGGGTQSRLLCQYTADVCALPVTAGPVEATALGNAAMQLISCGEITDPADVPDMIRRSEQVQEYVPSHSFEREYSFFKNTIMKG